MKRFLPSLVIVLFCVTVSFAQAPKGINYQGVARDNEGKPYSTKTISVRISILKNSASGQVEYSETHKPQTNQFGLFTLVIGQGTKLTGDFAFISWAVGNKWLQIEIDPNGGSSYTLAGSQQLMTVPYAFYAEYAGNSSGLTAGSGIAINSGVVSNTGDTDNDPNNELQNLSEVLIKSNNAGGIKITNLGAPVAATDAATKNYVDTQNALQNLAEILTKGNDAGAKQIKNLSAPTDANDAATKNYVDTKFALDLDIDPTNELQDLSQVLTNGNDAGGKKITNLGAPTLANDAATKSYVDSQNALDLDQSATNEIQDLTLNTTTNILNITNNTGATPINLTPYKQTLTYTPATNNLAISGGNNVTISSSLTQVLTTNPSAGNIRIQNVGTPTTPADATTKAYVDNAIATNYAFKINFSYTNSTAGLQIDQEMAFTAEEFDSFNVVGGNSFTATENGIYVFTLEGTYVKAGIINSGLISLFYNSTKYTIPMFIPFGSNTPRFNATFMFKLTAGQSIKILGEIVESGATFSGNFFGYKL